MYRFYDSSDSTILPQESTILPEDCYESDVPIPRFFRFYNLTSEFNESDVQILRFFRFYDFLQWMKERGIFVAFMYSYVLCYHFSWMTILR